MTRRGYVAAALVALVLLVVPLGLVPHVLAPLRADPGGAAAMTCDDPSAPAADVPTDVVAARMCATDEGLARWYAPQDSLHADLAPLVDLLGALEPVPESTDEERYFCTDDGGYGFDLRLALASGEVVSVPGDTGGCSTVRVGGEDVVGSDEVLATFLDALAAQRRTTEPPTTLVDLPLACGQDAPDADHRLSLIGDQVDLVRAVACWRPNADDVPPWRGERAVPSGPLARLVQDLATRSTRQDQFGTPDCPGGLPGYYWQDLVGQTRWGDVVAIRGVCRELMASPADFWQPGDEDAAQRYWHPSPAAQRILDGLRR